MLAGRYFYFFDAGQGLWGGWRRENIARMRIQLPVVICVVGGIYSLYFASKLRKLRLSDHPPKSRAHLSLEERQRKIRMAAWLCVVCGFGMIAGAVVLFWLENSN
jgi:hypothetical protein